MTHAAIGVNARAMYRLFVALRPPPAIRAALASLMEGVPGARWQDDEQLHLTLRYIGEVDRRLAEDAAVALSAIVAPPVVLRLDGIGRFERRGRANALWAGVAPHDAIAALHRKIDRALVRVGLAGEPRAYLPHITLARLGASTAPVEPWLARHAGLASEPFEIAHFGLYESHLGSEGARYEAIARWSLREGG